MAKYTLPFSKSVKLDHNEIFGMFIIITSKQQNFLSPIQSWSANFQKNCIPIQSWSGQYLLQSWSSPIQSWSVLISARDYHYAVCRLDIRKDSEFATRYGYPKSTLKREPDTDPDIRNAFIDISRIQTFGKSCTLHNHSFISSFRSIFSAICAMTPRLSMVYSLYHSVISFPS